MKLKAVVYEKIAIDNSIKWKPNEKKCTKER